MKFYFTFLLLIIASLQINGQISHELNESLADSLRPKNIQQPNLKELCAIVDNTALSLPDHYDEMESIVLKIKNQLPSLKNRDEKITALYTLMIFDNNFGFDETLLDNRSLITLIGKDKKGYEKQYFNCMMIKAGAATAQYNFEEAIDIINTALVEESKIKNRNVIAGAYLTIAEIYKKIHINDEVVVNLNKALSVADVKSGYYNDFLKNYVLLKRSELDLLNYIETKNDTFLKTAKANLKIAKPNDLQGRWLSLWHLQNAYISYFENDFSLSQQEFEIADKIPFEQKIIGGIACRYYTLKGLLLIKHKKDSEGIKFLEKSYEETSNEFYYDIALKELYQYYKTEKNYAKANFYLEKISETKTSQDSFKYKGAVFTANRKYDVREKQIKIEQLENKSKVSKAQNYLIISIISLLSIVIIGFLFIKNRQSKIKQLKKNQDFAENIKLMQEYLHEEQTKMELERTSIALEQRTIIGQNLHNDLLGNLVALDYLIKDYTEKATSENQKKAFEEINLEVNSIYKDSRKFSHSLTKQYDDENSFDLLKYLENLKTRFAEIGLLDIHYEIDKQKLDNLILPKVRTEIYYLIKESVSNTIKHAQASELNITIQFNENTCNVIISDNGIGFKASQNNGIGLSSITKRIEKIGGSISYETKSGTKIKAEIPIFA